MANLGFFEVVKRNNFNDIVIGLVEDAAATQYAPEFSQVPAIVRPGTFYNTLIRQTLPLAQFRQANSALNSASSIYKQIRHEMFFADVLIAVDEALYKADNGLTGDLLYDEGQGALQAMLILLGKQFYYGAAGDGSNGFVGIRSQLLPASQSYVTAVTASNSNTSSTAYGLWLNPQGVNFTIGNKGEIAFPPFQRQLVDSITATGQISGYAAWWSNISCYIGLSVASEYSCFGVTGVTQAAPFTDKLAAQLIATVPLTRRAGFVWFVNPSTYAGLQISRTAINYQPAGPYNAGPAWSPPPREVEGYPIVVTNSITNTENNT